VTFQLVGLRNTPSIALVISSLITALWCMSTWRFGFDLADEGYYWYGAQRMLHGEMPMRDFMAYDIGRYAWSAAVMKLLGDSGIVGARVGAALYQVCTIAVGVLLVLRATKNNLSTPGQVWLACVAAITLNLWVYPYYKVFDYGTSILIVAMLVMIFGSQSPRRWFSAGMLLGLAAIMGRNHGVYGAVAALLLLVFLLIKQRTPGALLRLSLAFIAGVVVGFSPTFVLCVLVDGFTDAFVASIFDLINSGATNISLDVPWPWTFDRSVLGMLLWANGVSQGIGFIAILALPLMAIALLMFRPLHRLTSTDILMLCTSLVGIIYAHYAYSRADLTHLALSIAPLLLLVLSTATSFKMATLTSAVVAGGTMICMAAENPLLSQWILNRPFATVTVNGSTLYVFPHIKEQLRHVEDALAARPQARDNFLALPNAPALYAINELRMPIWEIYSLWPRDAAFEAAEVAKLNRAPPDLVFLSDHALDNRQELRYSNTHPILYQWILDNYKKQPAKPLEPFDIYVK